MLLGGAEAGLQTTALPRGSLPGSQQPGRGCRPPNLPWSCPGKTGHSALLSADQRRGSGSCHRLAARIPVEEWASVLITTSCPEICRASTHVPSTHVPSTRLLPAGRRRPTESPDQAPASCLHAV